MNPIELCWSQVKGHIKEHNQKFTLSAVKDLTYEGFRRVGPEQWRKNISHVRDEVEDHYWIADNLQEERSLLFILEESYQRKKAAIQNQIAASVVMENRYK